MSKVCFCQVNYRARLDLDDMRRIRFLSLNETLNMIRLGLYYCIAVNSSRTFLPSALIRWKIREELRHYHVFMEGGKGIT